MHYGSHRPGGPGRTSRGRFRSNFRKRSIFRGRVRDQPSNPTRTSKTTGFTVRINPINQDDSPRV